MRRAHTRQPARDNLAALGNELRQPTHVCVVDRFDFFRAEFADFFAAKKFPAAWAAFASAGAGTRWSALGAAFAAAALGAAALGAAALSFSWCWSCFVSHNAPEISRRLLVIGCSRCLVSDTLLKLPTTND